MNYTTTLSLKQLIIPPKSETYAFNIQFNNDKSFRIINLHYKS